MSRDKGIERRLERYVLDELGSSDRELLEEYLTGTTPAAAAAREALRFERALLDALDVEPFEDDVAAAVLHRVFRRDHPTTGSWDEDVARRIARRMAERRPAESHTGPGFGRRWPLVRVAAAIFILGFTASLWWMLERSLEDIKKQAPGTSAVAENETRIEEASKPAMRPTLAPSVAEVAYASDIPSSDEIEPLRLVSRMAPRGAIRTGSEVETEAGESAVLRFTQGGAVVLRPGSRLRVSAGNRGGVVRLALEQGSFVYQLPAGGRPMELLTPDGRRIRLQEGAGVVALAGSAFKGAVPVTLSALHQVTVVRPRRHGRVLLEDGSRRVPVRAGQVGLVSASGTLAVEDAPAPLRRVVPRSLGFDAIVDRARAPALELPGHIYSRSDMAAELMRVYGEELLDLMTRSTVVRWALNEKGLRITERDRKLAQAIVRSDELSLVQPMRSPAALAERIAMTAGLLALRGKSIQEPVSTATAVARIRGAWRGLEPKVHVVRPEGRPDLLARIRFGSSQVDVTLREGWRALESYLTPAEVRRVVEDVARRDLAAAQLQRRGRAFPRIAIQPTRTQASLAHLAGLTRVQLQNAVNLNAAAALLPMSVSDEEVDRFLESPAATRKAVVFDHVFVPYVGKDGIEDRQEALRHAEEAARLLAAGESPSVLAMDSTEFSAPWRTGTAVGPRPWWPSLYGPDVVKVIMSSPLDEVGGPVAGPRGYHVIRVRRDVPDSGRGSALRRRWAAQVLRMEKVRLALDRAVARQASLFLGPRGLLD
ncbi:MAG TPA: hypothetical protein ENK43_04185 [Planctomycetes bacterium]|nr:hypothetical protein [Planctomycetota bacterium]